jgi:type I restriction enzyme S subunit
VFHKPTTSGADLGSKRVFWVHPGDFVLNIVFAWEGAVALLGEAETGMIGSHRFPTFRAHESHLDSRFLLAYFRTHEGRGLLRKVSPGGAGRNRTLSRNAFLEECIPLPPLTEQRRIVAQIEELTSRIDEARSIRTEASDEAETLVRAALGRLASSTGASGTLGDVLSAKPRNGWSAKCDNAEGGIPVLSLGAVTGFRYRSTEFKRTSLQPAKNGHFWLNPGDVLITRSNTPELVGHAAIYDGTPAPCIYPDLIMRLEFRKETVDRRFVWYWLRSPLVREFICHHAKGTSPTMKKISQGIVMTIPFPSRLSLRAQHRIVAELDALQAEVDALRQLQTGTVAELDALVPSILDRAFRGEL